MSLLRAMIGGSGSGRRALICSVVLFGVAAGLAAQMSAGRAADPLGSRFQPRGWRLSLRIPRGFIQVQPALTADYAFVRRQPDRTTAVLMIQRFRGDRTTSAEDVCLYAFGQAVGGSSGGLTPAPAVLGSVPAAELADPAGGIAVRAATYGENDAYAIWLLFDPPVEERILFDLLDRVCDSAEFRGG